MQIRRPLAFWNAPPWPGGDGGDGEVGGPPLILLYHSIVKVSSDPWGVRVKPRNFKEHMAVLRRHCHPMPLKELDQALTAGAVPKRAVAVTFDDGYVDNLLAAKPAMQQHSVPGTVFVSSGYVGSGGEYWWDEVDRLTLQPGALPANVSVKVGERVMEWKLGENAKIGRRDAWKNRHWFAWNPTSTARQKMFLEFWEVLRAAPSVAVRERAIDELRKQATELLPPRPTHQCCTPEQIRELSKGGLIEVGGHTVAHPSLGHLGVEDQRREIFDGKKAVEGFLQAPVESFAYPFGSIKDYSAATITLLKEAGYRRACSNFPAPIVPSVDRYQFPRRVVMDWDGGEFIRRLAGWFADRGDSRKS